MTDLADLIARLEAAKRGSDDLDRAICDACGIAWSSDEDGQFGGYGLLPRRCRFTRSVDAAITLVPNGRDYQLLRIGTGGVARSEAKVHMKPYMKSNPDDEMYGEAPTDALAICIAALKARA